MKLDFNDILIVPAIKTSIESRSLINNKYLKDGKHHLPIIAAPMDTVVDQNNIEKFEYNNINYCIPRNNNFNSRDTYGIMTFKSYSLDEFIRIFIKVKEAVHYNNRYILIDIANGHMGKLFSAVKDFKSIYGDYYKLMVGNVARPETYKELSLAGADFIRIGIGNGQGCLTTQQLGIGYPMASLIQECYELKQSLVDDHLNAALIVADGGMKDYSDIIKALALGSDYVMLGSIFNKALDSAGPTYFKGFKINQHSKFAKLLYNNGFKLVKKFRGMSTKEVQKNWNKGILKTSEGVVRYRPVEYTITSWTENFSDYLKSAMSYSDKYDLLDFIGNVNYIKISDNSYLRFNK